MGGRIPSSPFECAPYCSDGHVHEQRVFPSSWATGFICLHDHLMPGEFQDVTQDVDLAKRWRGLRQDSGDPLQFIIDAKKAYASIGIEPKEKVIIFSDSLNMDNCFKIKNASDEAGFICQYPSLRPQVCTVYSYILSSGLRCRNIPYERFQKGVLCGEEQGNEHCH